MRTESLGSDERTSPKAIYLLIAFTLVMFLIWTTANVPEELLRALTYGFITITGVMFILVDWLFKKKEYIDTVTYEKRQFRPPFFDKVPNWALGLMALLLVFYLFFSISSTQFSYVAAPSFQSTQFVSQSPFFRSLLSGIAGISENVLFFAVLFPTVYVNSRRWQKVPFLISLILAVLIVSTVFMFYHTLVYGVTQLTAFLSAFIFAAINCGMVFVFRNLVLSDVFHFTNNFLASWFSLGGRIAFVVVGGS